VSGSVGVEVAVTVVPAGMTRAIAEEVGDGYSFRPVRLDDLVAVDRLTPAEKTRELQRVVRAKSALAAYEAQLVVALAADRSDRSDRRPGSPGAAAPEWARDGIEEPLPGVSEFFPDELALVLNCSRTGATVLAEHSHTLVQTLPTTWAALADGLIDPPRARAFAAELGWPARNTDPRLVAEVEAAGLLRAGELSVRRLRKFLRRELIRRDPSASERRRKRAERSADVTVHAAEDGMAELRIYLPAPEAAAVQAAADARARAAKLAGDMRPLGMLRAAFVADSVLRPGGSGESTVSAHVTVIAPLPTLAGSGCDHAAEVLPSGALPAPVDPGEVDGHPITAGQLRDLLTQLDSLCPGGLQADRRNFGHRPDRPGDRSSARDRHPCRARATRPPRVPGPPRRRLRVPGPRPPGAGRPVPPLPRPGALRADPRPDVPAPRLHRPGCMGRPRPRHSARRRRPDRLRHSLLPLPPAPPAQDACPRLALRDDSRRHAHSDHSWRRNPHHPPTRLARSRRRATPPGRDADARRPASVLTGSSRRAPQRRLSRCTIDACPVASCCR
jgi:hypothetical protein